MRHTLALLVACAATCFGAHAGAQNLFTNPSFEAPITLDGPPFVGSWEGFNGGGASAASSTLMPRTGLGNVDLSITFTPNTFAGVFQDVPVVAGDLVSFCGWNKSLTDPLQLGAEVRIEFRSTSIAGPEISRTLNLVPAIGSQYSLFVLNATVPAGATIARAVYAIQSFSTQPLGNGLVSIDDFEFKIVPEPTSLALGALALAPMGLRRRAR
jgi:hypothetical protein